MGNIPELSASQYQMLSALVAASEQASLRYFLVPQIADGDTESQRISVSKSNREAEALIALGFLKEVRPEGEPGKFIEASEKESNHKIRCFEVQELAILMFNAVPDICDKPEETENNRKPN